MTAGVLEVTLFAYREVLGNPDIAEDDDFFELGGDSVQAMDVIALVAETLDVDIPVGLFFASPTPAELAEAVGTPPGAVA
ncbi:acyl carrier protein [Amycolatopsis sp. NPDC005003]